MKRLSIAIVLMTILLPQEVAATSLYDTFYKEAEASGLRVHPTEQITQFVIDEMKTWHQTGIQLTPDDVTAAMADNLATLCGNKFDVESNSIQFIYGGTGDGESCMALRDDIVSLVQSEQEIDDMGTTLLTIADGAELASANEPHRPVEMGKAALLLKRVWIGTGAGIIPWDTAWDSDANNLDAKVAALSPEDLEKAILRFHHGYYRDQREADPAFAGIANDVRDALQQLANTMGIADDPSLLGEYATPILPGTPNVAFWARKDDIGLMWVYPTHFFRLKIKRADEYPKIVTDGERLAYPYSYEGSTPPTDPKYRTPLCSRMMGRYGYLCRPMPQPAKDCVAPGDTGISLVMCSEEATQTEVGPKACTDIEKLFDDNGESLTDPADPAKINPALSPADLDTICDPDKKILYQDDITSHSCYISQCLIQSMNTHTLVPNRNTVVLNEATSPYLACIRTDPQLGKYMEVPHFVPYSFPPYVGHLLTNDYEREYCVTNGNAPHPIAGFCKYRESRKASMPDFQPVFWTMNTTDDLDQVAANQEGILSDAAGIGERAALEQSTGVQQKVFGAIAAFIQQVADLLLQLETAPLTKTPCPWTGPFTAPPSP